MVVAGRALGSEESSLLNEWNPVTVEAADQQASVLSALTFLMSFSEAAERVLDLLRSLIPMSSWSVTAHDRERDQQVYLHVRDDNGRSVGSTNEWSQTFCRFMVTGEGPVVAADVMAVPRYADVNSTAGLGVGAYIGVPIRTEGGQLFGTLCATDPRVQVDGALEQYRPLLETLATLLGQILVRERQQTEGEEREAALRWRAFHDELTGLPNRALFTDRLDQALALHQRDGRSLALLTLDVDDFKAVNDTFGHSGGDELLKQLAHRLRGATHTTDTVARLGGDEFAVLLEHRGDTSSGLGAEQVAERILAALHGSPFLVGGRRLEVGVSVGVAALEPGANPSAAEALLNHADVALYQSKRDGKFRSTLYDSNMQLPATRDLALREPLREAIKNGDIQDFYQPVVALNPFAMVKTECLARWTYQGTPVSPEVFIPLAARSRLLPALTTLMVARACDQLSRWCRTLGHDKFGVAVNMPPSLLTDPTFPSLVAAQVDRAGLQPHQITLEVTEDALLNDFNTARRIAEELHERGFRLALDDFGTGYSSLLHLRSIPLNVVKIDRGFTSDVDSNPQTRRFMRALITMGHDLGMRVIVEGVERESQADVLLDLGATHAQGYFYARPTPADQLDLSTVKGLAT